MEDKVEEVAWNEIDRGNWREPGNKSSSSDEDETESEIGPS